MAEIAYISQRLPSEPHIKKQNEVRSHPRITDIYAVIFPIQFAGILPVFCREDPRHRRLPLTLHQIR